MWQQQVQINTHLTGFQNDRVEQRQAFRINTKLYCRNAPFQWDVCMFCSNTRNDNGGTKHDYSTNYFRFRLLFIASWMADGWMKMHRTKMNKRWTWSGFEVKGENVVKRWTSGDADCGRQESINSNRLHLTHTFSHRLISDTTIEQVNLTFLFLMDAPQSIVAQRRCTTNARNKVIKYQLNAFTLTASMMMMMMEQKQKAEEIRNVLRFDTLCVTRTVLQFTIDYYLFSVDSMCVDSVVWHSMMNNSIVATETNEDKFGIFNWFRRICVSDNVDGAIPATGIPVWPNPIRRGQLV